MNHRYGALAGFLLAMFLIASDINSRREAEARQKEADAAAQLELLHDITDPVVAEILLDHYTRRIPERRNPNDFCNRPHLPAPQGSVRCSVKEVESKGAHSGGNLPVYHISLIAYDDWTYAAQGHGQSVGEVKLVLYPDAWIGEPEFTAYPPPQP